MSDTDDRLHVTPPEGVHLRDPSTREPLPTEGKWVPRDRFWLRRVAAGDVINTTATALEREQQES